ncbi:MerR family transcriptional regulator [Paenibacillus sp. GSMTC-2017]|uniref:MerR family transcriptional regulator n=1 Tax=Paenibacillus sp. GSMTC-2017 TaxID=2794350 RepID=UPI0018D97F45|nr:MerR family transcriptional regulator [Paenibacillus sp. GSMTC-2017]MBH5320910.1 MerR family transcriptional regulator [Paenibacillus sp. GSMTC-2017]
MYSIGQLSKNTNISVSTLRYYDEIGLLKPAKVAHSGYRYYSNEEIEILQHIAALKELGFTLAAIKEMLSTEKDSKEQRWRNFLEVELAAVIQERKRLDEMEKLLLTTRNAFEMKGEIDSEDIFLFIKALKFPPEAKETFLTQNFTEREINIIKNLPDLSSDDPRSMEWAKLIRKVKEHMHEPPSSIVSQKLAKQIIEATMEWFQQDEQLLDKYWSLIRPEEGMETKVYGMDNEAMDHIDRIVDCYLQNVQEGDGNGS